MTPALTHAPAAVAADSPAGSFLQVDFATTSSRLAVLIGCVLCMGAHGHAQWRGAAGGARPLRRECAPSLSRSLSLSYRWLGAKDHTLQKYAAWYTASG